MLYREFFPLILGWCIWFFTPIVGVIGAIGFLLIMDFISGIWSAKVKKEQVSSRKAGRTLKKLIFYNIAIITGHACSLYVTDLIPWVEVISGLVVLIEFGSLLENISVITGVKLWTYVRYYIKKTFKLDLEDYRDREKVIDQPEIYNDIIGKKILVADSNQINKNIICEFLSNFDISCTTVATGKQAVTCLIEDEFDLVFVDIDLEELDGVQVAKSIKTNDNINSNTPIILMSQANSHSNTSNKIDPTLFQGYITKPFDLDMLYSQILKLIN